MKKQARHKIREQPGIRLPVQVGKPRPPFAKSKLLKPRFKGYPALPVKKTVSYDPVAEATPSGLGIQGSDLPIQGGNGGKFQINLSGIGIELHKEAFAFRMPDDSLAGMHIHRGDIAILEPCRRVLRDGDLVLLLLKDNFEVLRRITYCGDLMYFRADDASREHLLPAWEYPFYGVVTAVLRTFELGEMLTPPPEPVSTKTHPARLVAQRDAHLTSGGALGITRLMEEPHRYSA